MSNEIDRGIAPEEFHREERSSHNGLGWVAAAVLLLFSTFHLYTAFFGILPELFQRIVHLGFVLVVTFLLYPAIKGRIKNRILSGLDLLMVFVTIAITVYGLAESTDAIGIRAGIATTADTLFGVLLIIFLLEAGRRVMGYPMPLIALAFILYAMAGPYMPGPLQHRGYDLERIVQQLYLSYEGIFGLPLAVASTFIVMFVIFGAFLQESGGGQLFIDIAYRLMGRVRGGPAKMAVVSSGLFGTVSGSAVANVVVDGWLTIPLMVRTGFSPHVAAAVEAVASTGGQLMPPVMGAAAFVIADILGISYFEVCLAAAIPAVLYYVTLFFMVDFEAARLGLRGVSATEMPHIENVGARIHLLIPIAVLIFFLGVLDWSPLKSAGWSVVIVFAVSWLKKKTWMKGPQIVKALRAGAKGTLEVSLACAMAGIVVGVFSLTGLGLKLSTMLLELAGGNLLVLLVLTMFASLILGMGLPTVACYIILAVLVAPALIKMGVAPIAAHLFIFYFGLISAITPPVALAAYAAAGIAKTDPFKTGWAATRIGIAGLLLPYFFVYGPAMVMIGPWSEIALACVSGIVGVIALAAGVQGYLFKRANVIQRIALLIAGVLLIKPGILTDLAGYAIVAVVLVAQINLGKRRKTRNAGAFL
jgi:TRAP transporter 4TM/12TM fusion protein